MYGLNVREQISCAVKADFPVPSPFLRLPRRLSLVPQQLQLHQYCCLVILLKVSPADG